MAENGRVHQHDAWLDAGVEMIINVSGVETGDGDAGKEEREKLRAGLGKFVKNERRT